MEIKNMVEQIIAEKNAAQLTKDNQNQTTQKAQKEKEAAEKKKKEGQNPKDKLSLSIDGKEMYQYNKTYQKAKNDEMIIKKHEEMRKKALERKKKEKQSAQYKAKMMEIARRIANGDKVPAEDERKLREFNQELYLTVKSMALLNKKPKEYDSLFDDKNQDSVSIENEEEKPSLMDTMSDILSDSDGETLG